MPRMTAWRAIALIIIAILALFLASMAVYFLSPRPAVPLSIVVSLLG